MSAIDRTLTCSSDGCNLATTAVTHTFSYGHYLESTALQIENYSDTHTLALQALFTPQTDLSDCRWGEALRFSLTTDTASGGQTLYDRLPVSTLATQPIAWEVAPDTTRTYYFVWTHTPRDYLSLRAFDNRDFVYQWTLDVEGQVNSSPEPTLPDPPPTPPPSPAPEATSAGTPTPEATPSAQLTPEATTSGDLTPEATPAASPIPSADPSVTPEASPTPTPQVNPASSPTPASSATASPTPASPLPVSAPSTTPAPTASSTPVSSASITSDASSTHPNDTGFTTTAKSNSASTITVPDVQAIIAADQTTSSASHRARARDNQQPNQVSTASQAPYQRAPSLTLRHPTAHSPLLGAVAAHTGSNAASSSAVLGTSTTATPAAAFNSRQESSYPLWRVCLVIVFCLVILWLCGRFLWWYLDRDRDDEPEKPTPS